MTLPPQSVVERRPRETDPIYSIMLDEPAAILRVRTSGFWTVAEAEEYFIHLSRFFDDSRTRYGLVKILVDRRGNPIQTGEVADRLGRANRELYLPCDRLAVVVDSNLAKGQMRRRFGHEGSRAFLSYEAAETWLSAFA